MKTGGLHRRLTVGFESLANDNIAMAEARKVRRTEDYACRVEILHACGIQVNGSFVLGFRSYDGPDVFERTAAWIESNRLGEMRDLSHIDPLSRHAALRPDGSGEHASCTETGRSTTPGT